MLGKSLKSTGRGECARVGDRHDRDQDNSIEDGWENLDTGELNGDDEWRMTTGGSLSLVEWGVGWDNQSD